ncbi:MAG: glycosyltransferase family A protein [Chlorobiaceae bacterium]
MRFSVRPEVSVILPSFNRAAHLETAIKSVIRQTFADWELIIVDDGSTDDTFKRVDPYIQCTSKIRYMKHSNRKQALSRNAGMQASFGRHITFLDSDDHYLENHLESRMAIIRARPDIMLLSGGFLSDETIMVKDRHNPEMLVHIRECTLGGTLFGKRELFFAIEGFKDLDYAEDSDLWERAVALFATKKIEEPKTYVYGRAADSITLNH